MSDLTPGSDDPGVASRPRAGRVFRTACARARRHCGRRSGRRRDGDGDGDGAGRGAGCRRDATDDRAGHARRRRHGPRRAQGQQADHRRPAGQPADPHGEQVQGSRRPGAEQVVRGAQDRRAGERWRRRRAPFPCPDGARHLLHHGALARHQHRHDRKTRQAADHELRPPTRAAGQSAGVAHGARPGRPTGRGQKKRRPRRAAVKSRHATAISRESPACGSGSAPPAMPPRPTAGRG